MSDDAWSKGVQDYCLEIAELLLGAFEAFDRLERSTIWLGELVGGPGGLGMRELSETVQALQSLHLVGDAALAASLLDVRVVDNLRHNALLVMQVLADSIAEITVPGVADRVDLATVTAAVERGQAALERFCRDPAAAPLPYHGIVDVDRR